MNKQYRIFTYKRAIEKWGVDAQMDMAQEESTELALAIRKYRRNPNDETFESLIGEIADVEIMIEQIRLIHKPTNMNKRINEIKEYKINRLGKRLDENQFNSIKKQKLK